jgi:hypothetical protein
MTKMNECAEIRTLEDFRRRKSEGKGYILVTDSANGNKIHSPGCMYVKEEYFTKKVVEGHNKNGRYYWAATKDAASAKAPNTRSCQCA